MIGPADDFLIHQTHEPVRYAATSDRRFFYDRYFFTGHRCADDLFFMIGIGAYPNLGVIDAFGSVALGSRQYTTRASRELGSDRMNTRAIGPFHVEVHEGLKRLSVRCDPAEGQAVHFALEWNAAVPAFEEPPILQRVMGRVMEQATRLIQTGTWSGYIACEGQVIELDPDTAWGARDRSWGVRSIGLEREPKGIQQAKGANKARTTLWIWSPMQFGDETVHFSLSEYPDGRRDIETVRRMPGFGADGAAAVEEMLGGAEHDLRFDLETRELLEGSSISYLEADGTRRHVRLTPLRRAYLRAGTGYGGPDPWRHGMYMGEDWCHSVTYDLSDPAVTAKIGPTHVLCRMERDDGAVGYGTFETQVFGAYPRYGFHE
ncbi:hypothetical protein ACFSTD_19305 [Novosphingobium colocasiae]